MRTFLTVGTTLAGTPRYLQHQLGTQSTVSKERREAREERLPLKAALDGSAVGDAGGDATSRASWPLNVQDVGQPRPWRRERAASGHGVAHVACSIGTLLVPGRWLQWRRNRSRRRGGSGSLACRICLSSCGGAMDSVHCAPTVCLEFNLEN